MEIFGSHLAQSAQSVSSAQSASLRRPSESGETTRPQQVKDEVQLSETARNMSDVSPTESSSSAVRFELVNSIRSQIAAGTYDSPEKMEAALEKMFARIGF